jgi:cytochrome c oxidase subunit 3
MTDRAERLYQTDTAIIGMWLFLATEMLFFGALFFVFLICRHLHPEAMDQGVHRTNLLFGSINTVLLLTSSLMATLATACATEGDRRGLVRWLGSAAMLGVAFLALKGVEYADDFREGLFPGPDFSAVKGNPGPQQLFFICYFIATAVHALHMLIGLGLIAWVVRRALHGDFDKAYWTPAAAVALYWSFVDIIWIFLYPLLYLVGRGPS